MTETALHFGVEAHHADAAIARGLTIAADLAPMWVPPIVTHADQWEDWHEPVSSGDAVHMVMVTRDSALALDTILNDPMLGTWLVPMHSDHQRGTTIALTDPNDWGIQHSIYQHDLDGHCPHAI